MGQGRGHSGSGAKVTIKMPPRLCLMQLYAMVLLFVEMGYT